MKLIFFSTMVKDIFAQFKHNCAVMSTALKVEFVVDDIVLFAAAKKLSFE